MLLCLSLVWAHRFCFNRIHRPTLNQCRSTVYDGGPTLNQHWSNASRFRRVLGLSARVSLSSVFTLFYDVGQTHPLSRRMIEDGFIFMTAYCLMDRLSGQRGPAI